MVNESVFQILLYVAAFISIWWGSGLVVASVSSLAYSLKLPAFTISFFILGVLTSLPEMAIGVTSVITGDPGIFVGNLVGGVVVLFLFVIPLLALVSNGVTIPKQLNKFSLVGILIACFLPTLFISDRTVDRWEAWVSIGFYILLFLFFSKEQGMLERIKHTVRKKRGVSLWDVVRIIAGVFLLVLGSHQIVDSTLYFADVLNIAPFFVGLIIIALGTNIPEITLIFRALVEKKHDVALADYLGSASANTFLFGVLSLIYPGTIQVPNHYFHRFAFVLVGFVLIFIFMRSKNKLSMIESIFLLLLYIIFIIMELSLI